MLFFFWFAHDHRGERARLRRKREIRISVLSLILFSEILSAYFPLNLFMFTLRLAIYRRHTEFYINHLFFFYLSLHPILFAIRLPLPRRQSSSLTASTREREKKTKLSIKSSLVIKLVQWFNFHMVRVAVRQHKSKSKRNMLRRAQPPKKNQNPALLEYVRITVLLQCKSIKFMVNYFDPNMHVDGSWRTCQRRYTSNEHSANISLNTLPTAQ